MSHAEERSVETAGDSDNNLRRPLPSQKSSGLSQVRCKVPGFEAGCLCLLWKMPTSKNGAVGWHLQTAGTQGSLRQAEGKSGEITGNAGNLPWRPLSSQTLPVGYPGWVVKPQILEQGACVPRGRPPQGKTGWQCGRGGTLGLRGMLRQAEGRGDETPGKAVSVQMRPLRSQKPPGVSHAGCEAPGFGEGCQYLSQKAHTSENGAKRMGGQQGFRMMLRQAVGGISENGAAWGR